MLCFLLNVITPIVILLTTLLYLYTKHKHQYWHRKNTPNLPPTTLYGNAENPFKKTLNIGIEIGQYYAELKAQSAPKHGGMYIFTTPNYVAMNPEMAKHILVKDFSKFTDRGFYYNEKADPLTGHLIALGGQRWRIMRAKLSPTFTSARMKLMFRSVLQIAQSLSGFIENNTSRSLDLKEIIGSFTSDVIGSCAFGLEMDSFKGDTPFKYYSKKIFAVRSKPYALYRLLCDTFPNVALKLNLKVLQKDISDFFMSMVKNTVKYRRTNKVTRNDFFQLLLNMNSDSEEHFLTIEEIAAQCFAFLLAGSDTSSTAMTFALYELSRNEDIQKRVRNEIMTVLDDREITYELIKDMKYLDMVLQG